MDWWDRGTNRRGWAAAVHRGGHGRDLPPHRRLREDVEILKRATAFFAKETR